MEVSKEFGTAMFGYRKSDVDAYIEKILRGFDEKLWEKDDSLTTLRKQFEELRQKHEDLKVKAAEIDEDKSRIADVLLQAQGQAKTIIESAQTYNEDEKKRIDGIIEQEREKIVNIKQQLKFLRDESAAMLRQFEAQLTSTVDKVEKQETVNE